MSATDEGRILHVLSDRLHVERILCGDPANRPRRRETNTPTQAESLIVMRWSVEGNWPLQQSVARSRDRSSARD
jgi:hypothetical protein